MSEDLSAETPHEEYEDRSRAVFYALEHAPTPLTESMIADRPETDGFSLEEIREGIEDRRLSTVDYEGVTAYYLDRESSTVVKIDREMYEGLRDKGHYIGEDPHGVNVHLQEDYRTIGRVKSEEDSPDWETWGPMFPLRDDDDLDETKPVTEHSSKNVMLEATTDDIVGIENVHAGMHRVPEKMRVVRRTNTYHGPAIRLIPPEDWPGERTNYELTCPDRYSNLVLWKAVTDHEGYIQKWVKIARVTAEIFNVAGYDICASCEEPIKDPMHRSMAMLGQCNGGFNDGE